MATEVAADAPGEEWKGYMVRVCGRKGEQFFHEARCLVPWQSAPGILVRDEGELRRKVPGCSGMHCGCHSGCFQLPLLKKRKERYSWTNSYFCASVLEPTKLAESGNFSVL